MKKLLLIISLLTLSIFAQEPTMGHKMPTRFQAVPMAQAQLVQEGKNRLYCTKCGMTLPMFYKTNHASKVEGVAKQYCSIHCLADALNHDSNVSELKVVDNTTLKFVDANTAWYVIGSSKAGTMSKISKYAFAIKSDAQTFYKEFGGEVKDFNSTINMVKENLAKESKMIAKKQAMMAKKGEMMFAKICKPIEEKFNSVAQAKSYLKTNQPCGDIKGKKLQAIALYLNARK